MPEDRGEHENTRSPENLGNNNGLSVQGTGLKSICIRSKIIPVISIKYSQSIFP